MKKKVLICLLIVVVFSLTGCNGKYKFDVYDAVGYTSLRKSIAESVVYGGSIMPEKHFKQLSDAVKKSNSKNEWFDNDSIFIGVTKDTSDYDITMLCNDYYCATFTVKNDLGDYYLIDYTFLPRTDEKGYEFFVQPVDEE